MNLNNLVAGAIASVNPDVMLSIQVSTGTTQNAQFQLVPSYAAPVSVPGQVQPMTWKDIQQTDGLNLQGVKRAIYINGHVHGLIRAKNKGGDLITDPNGNVWLVTTELEEWPNWCRVAVILQDNS